MKAEAADSALDVTTRKIMLIKETKFPLNYVILLFCDTLFKKNQMNKNKLPKLLPSGLVHSNM